VAVVESSGVPSFSVTVGGREASREGAVEERTWHVDVDERDGAKMGRAAAGAFYGGPVARQRERGRGSGVDGGRAASSGHTAWGGAGGGSGREAGPGCGGARSSTVGVGERCERGGGLVRVVPHGQRRRGGLARRRRMEESGEGSDTGATHSEGETQRSRNPGAVGTVACGWRGRQRSGVACMGCMCRCGPTGERRELGRSVSNSADF
jgi:hypothetical protein